MDTPCEFCEHDASWASNREYHVLIGPNEQPITVCNVCLDRIDLGAWHTVLYERHGTGCCLHVVTDDGNIADSDVNFCIEDARRVGHTFCRILAQEIARLSVAERVLFWRNGDEEVCYECGHDRSEHCHCGSACMRCNCPRYRNLTGLAPCPNCLETHSLVKVAVGDGRYTYRCNKCTPAPRET